jgi:hypothetical protein
VEAGADKLWEVPENLNRLKDIMAEISRKR